MPEAMSATERVSEAQISAAPADRANSRRNGVLCAVIIAASVLVIYPVADMPFGDDFSYTKTALEFARTGHFVYNGWATAMLGWMVPWGALFIKLFGFSFTAVRLSMLPIAMASVFLFHQILRRFGINAQNAVLGALTLGLSPLFLPMAATYMTDVPGLLVILVCIYMCQRAVGASSDSSALLWLISATLLNVAGGTVRQIAWLGALIMVPSTAWLLRDKRGMKAAGIVLFLCSFAGVIACLHWFNLQPYSVPEHVIQGPVHLKMVRHLAAQLLKSFFCLLLVIFPVSVAWLKVAHRPTTRSALGLTSAMMGLALLAYVLYLKGALDAWVEPWLVAILQSEGMWSVNLWLRLGISLLVVAPAIGFLAYIASNKPNQSVIFSGSFSSWSELVWILAPFTVSYLLLLTPRATFSFVQDRYLLGLMPTAIVVLLKLYQERVATKLSLVSVVALAIFSIYAISIAHDMFVGCRALASTIQMIQRTGVPRTSMEAGFANDGWTQIEKGGHINDSRIRVPFGAYSPIIPGPDIPEECRYYFASLTPAIKPEYFIAFPPLPCLAPTQFGPVPYRTLLPPFDRAIYVQRLRVEP